MPTIETMEKLKAFFAGIHTLNTDALIVGLVCLAILIITPRFTEKIPGSLLAIIGGILMVKLLLCIMAAFAGLLGIWRMILSRKM